jgi:sulfotransferase family protein
VAGDPFEKVLRRAARTSRRRRSARLALRSLGPVLPRVPPPRRPVFVVGSPRSGTTLVFDVLSRSSHLASLDRESHLLWDMFHDLPDSGWASHALGPDDVTDPERRVLYWAIRHLAGGRRYLDKAPRNSLRVPYLEALFPGAMYVHVKRDGRAAVSSLLTGWRDGAGMFPGIRMPIPLSVRGYEDRTWKFIVPPGWRELVRGHSLAEVCAFQWVAANEALLAARDSVGEDRWVEVAYEDFVRDPREETGRLMKALDVPVEDVVLEAAAALDRHVVKSVTPPEPGKWRRENPSDVEEVLPLIAPTMVRLGYDSASR